jgi:molybdopterin molybdotransferase
MAIIDCCSQPGLRPYLDAKNDMLSRLEAIAATDIIPLEQALNHILAEAVSSPIDVPSFANSAMDGYALRAEDLVEGQGLQLVGTSLAGHPFGGRVGPGECVRIMTGAALPLGADSVVMQENCRSEHNVVYPCGPVKTGQHVRLPAEDLAQGEVVFDAGTRINARVLSVLASLGLEQICVRRPLTLALLSTGDELKNPGELLAPGDIYDSNRIGVRAMLERLGIRVLDYGILADDPELIREHFLKAAREADALITSGGVSVGTRTTPNRCWKRWAGSASGSWPSSRASPSPSAISATAPSSACPATRYPPPSPSTCWCAPPSPAWPASASHPPRCCRPGR